MIEERGYSYSIIQFSQLTDIELPDFYTPMVQKIWAEQLRHLCVTVIVYCTFLKATPTGYAETRTERMRA